MLKVARILEDQIPNLTWNFIGGKADQFTELIDQLDFKRKTINFIDHVTQKELAVYFKNASLFVLFSNYENLPCVILEAFSSGLPVISTNVGGIEEYFPSNFGCLIEKGNTKQLAEKIKEAGKQKYSNKREMHLYAKKHFSKEAIATNFSKLYNQAINNQI
jgi:glycosyltransferase involved in cell wall biosynthesis